MRLFTFSEFQEHTTPILRKLKNFKQGIIKSSPIKSNIFKLIYLYYNDQLPLKIKDIFTANESANLLIPYLTLIQFILIKNF